MRSLIGSERSGSVVRIRARMVGDLVDLVGDLVELVGDLVDLVELGLEWWEIWSIGGRFGPFLSN